MRGSKTASGQGETANPAAAAKPAKAAGNTAVAPATAAPEPKPARPGKAPPQGNGGAVAADAAKAPETEEDQRGYTMAAFWHDSSCWMVSAVFHMIVLLVLALTWMTMAGREEDRFLVTTIEGEEMDKLEESTLEDQLDDIELEQDNALPIDLEDPGMAALGEAAGIDTEAVVDVGTVHISETMGDIGALFGEDGRGWASAGDGMGGAEFYGVKASGQKFVFVVDNSLSMSKGRFEAACIELFKSVARMSPYQSFYVFFFSDTAYPLFHPTPATGWVKADADNKMLLKSWLPSVELVLKTNAQGAMRKAIAMKPDGIYILTDGMFTDGTHKFLMGLTPQQTKVRSIHTVGMELDNPKAVLVLQSIAKQHNGTYRLVHVDPRIRAAVGKGSRPRHHTWHPIWGIQLPKQRPGGRGGPKARPKPGGGAGKKAPAKGGGKGNKKK